MQVVKADRTLMKIILQNKLFTPPKISVMQYVCGDILYGILSADMKSLQYIIVINAMIFCILFTLSTSNITYMHVI